MAKSTQELRQRSGNGQQRPTSVRGMMALYKDQIEAALPRHMNADRMARIAMTEIRRTPMLQKCDPVTLFGAVIQASQLGVEPGGALGHAHLVPFKDNRNNKVDVQLIIGYRGMIDLARRSGQIASLTARAVYEADEFTYRYGLNEDLHHVPSDEEDPGALTHVYAVAHLKGGGVQFEVMPVAKIEKVRRGRKGAPDDWTEESGPWGHRDHYVEMAKKTVIRALFKYLPVSVEIQRAVALDEQGDAGVSQDHGAVIDLDQGDYGPADQAEADAQGDAPPAEQADAPAEEDEQPPHPAMNLE